MRFVALVFVLGGCGGRQNAALTRVAPDEAAVVDGLSVVRMERPTAGLLRTRLLIAGGTRDATPALVTMMAWSLESEQVRATAMPDRIELEVECEADASEQCTAALVAAMQGSLDEERHSQLAARLRHSARVARADSDRRAVSLAAAAAWNNEGADAFAGFEEIPSRASITELRQRHLSLAHAMLVFEGDLSGDPDAARVAAALPEGASPAATAFSPSDEPQIRVEGGGRDALALAFHYADARRARAIAEDFAEEGLVTHLARLRDGALVTVEVTSGSLTEHDAHHARLLIRRAQSAARRTDWPPSPIELWQRLPQDENGRMGVGVGLVCEDGDAFAACQSMVEEHLAEDLASFEGEQNEHGAVGRFNAGGELFVRRQPGDMGVAILWQGGSSEDPPESHGRRAVAAIALARRCGGSPHTSAHHFGFARRVARGDEEALAQTLTCASAPIEQAEWNDAREHAHRVASQEPERGWAAEAIAPGMPGWVSALGRPLALASATLGAWTEEARSRMRLRIAIVGDVDVEQAVQAAGLTTAALPDGSQVTSAVAPPMPERSIIPEDFEGESRRVVVAWRGAGSAGAAGAAEAHAQSAAVHLASRGLRVRWSSGGGDLAGAHSMVALALSDAQIDALPQLCARIEVTPEVIAEVDRRHRRLGADAVEAALRAARTGGLDVAAPSEQTVRSLVQATPVFVIGRPQNSEALRRSRRN